MLAFLETNGVPQVEAVRSTLASNRPCLRPGDGAAAGNSGAPIGLFDLFWLLLLLLQLLLLLLMVLTALALAVALALL